MSDDLRAHVRTIPDFPQPGVLFRDITPLLASGPAFRQVVDWLVGQYEREGIEAVVGIESRGFIFGCPLADRLGAGLHSRPQSREVARRSAHCRVRPGIRQQCLGRSTRMR